MATYGSLEGKLVVLLGGSGFFGKHIAQELLERGARLRIASRNPEAAFTLKPLADLGQLQFVRCDITKPDGLAVALDGAHAAVNLVGVFKGDLEAIMGDAAGSAAKAAKEAGAKAFVQVSAIGADAESDVGYARAKAIGERAVLSEFPKATIIRPPVLFAEDDNFINMFAKLISTFPALPVFAPEAKLQPLHVDDAAAAVVAALANPAKHGGKTFEIAGPVALTMAEINRKIAAAQNRDRLFIELPDFVSETFASATGWLPFAPISRDQLTLLQQGGEPSGKFPGIDKLGISPRPLDLYLDRWMTRYRKHGRFGARA
ncbi:NAD(P)H-binding protein [Altererythrobacter sp. ZODW24]|uniref:NAD(P)H-binding protein n=1 Tax=Altererythrobacter sp. ZODW24 TaxID=2185142 RepID=UPI000DF733B3|nr:NAD(P)H-binding protein [Altererythrobacter sp. ZODW24]